MADRAAADERLSDGPHLDGGREPRGDADVLQGVLERQGIDDRREHAHVVGGGAVHALGAGRKAPEEVAAADDDARLDAELLNFADLGGDLAVTSGSMPKDSSPISASPDSFRRTRL